MTGFSTIAILQDRNYDEQSCVALPDYASHPAVLIGVRTFYGGALFLEYAPFARFLCVAAELAQTLSSLGETLRWPAIIARLGTPKCAVSKEYRRCVSVDGEDETRAAFLSSMIRYNFTERSAIVQSGQRYITNCVPITQVPEVERLKLQNLFLQQQLLKEQLNSSILQFLQTPEAKALQDKINELAKHIHSLAEDIFASASIDPKEYQFNIETGQFVKRQP